MKLLITRNTVAQLRQVRPGDVVEVTESEARVLKAANKAIDADADAKTTRAARPNLSRKATRS